MKRNAPAYRSVATGDGFPSAEGSLRDYIAIARPDHWFKNVFVLPGAFLALVLSGHPLGYDGIVDLVVALAATCLLASANYTINEWLDAEFDRHHPTKRARPSAAGRVAAPFVYGQWALLAMLGLALATSLGHAFLVFASVFLLMGILYNVRPFRTKERPYLDILSESFNNPLRFMLGWTAIVSDVMPPSSALLAYWMGGAFLMTVKRYAEYRFIGNPETAGLYRRSFALYTEKSLLLLSFFFGLSTAFFLGVFMIKYRIELILIIPFLALLFVWYLLIGMRANSVVQTPEKLYRERPFLAYLAFVSLLFLLLFVVDLPWLSVLVEHRVLSPA